MRPLGSPPQAWGHLPDQAPVGGIARLTPTGVGTSSPPPSAHPTASAHPHRRGDILTPFTSSVTTAGSPPQAWGHLPHPHRLVLVGGLTPTGVGTSAAACRAVPSLGAHPHRRGDIRYSLPTFREPLGSPPQAWGHHALRVNAVFGARLTPTGVGTSPAPPAHSSATRAHPHRRGDIDRVVLLAGSDWGSPPQAWGHQQPPRVHAPRRRLTPTGVGTSLRYHE